MLATGGDRARTGQAGEPKAQTVRLRRSTKVHRHRGDVRPHGLVILFSLVVVVLRTALYNNLRHHLCRTPRTAAQSRDESVSVGLPKPVDVAVVHPKDWVQSGGLKQRHRAVHVPVYRTVRLDVELTMLGVEVVNRAWLPGSSMTPPPNDTRPVSCWFA